MGRVVRTLVLSPFTNPLAVQVSVGFGASKFFVRLFAAIAKGACVTDIVPDAEEAKKLPCAAKLAESEWLPALSMPTEYNAEPLVSAIVDAAPPSTLRVTLPATVPPVELTETVTLPEVP